MARIRAISHVADVHIPVVNIFAQSKERRKIDHYAVTKRYLHLTAVQNVVFLCMWLFLGIASFATSPQKD
jgi:hypothetical protein